MAVFLVDRHIPGITTEQMSAAMRAVDGMSQQYAARGKAVRHIKSIFVPAESHCLSLFEASSATIVQEVNEAAQIPFTRIIEALELTP